MRSEADFWRRIVAELLIADHLLKRISALAQHENRSVEDVLETLLDQYAPDVEEALATENPLLALALASEQLNLQSGRNDVSERFDDVLG
jgi:hypothetical protein